MIIKKLKFHGLTVVYRTEINELLKHSIAKCYAYLLVLTIFKSNVKFYE